MNNREKALLGDADGIQVRLVCGIEAVGSIHEAMENGTLTAESHLDAIYGAYDYLKMLNKELRLALDGMYAGLKVAV